MKRWCVHIENIKWWNKSGKKGESKKVKKTAGRWRHKIIRLMCRNTHTNINLFAQIDVKIDLIMATWNHIYDFRTGWRETECEKRPIFFFSLAVTRKAICKNVKRKTTPPSTNNNNYFTPQRQHVRNVVAHSKSSKFYI